MKTKKLMIMCLAGTMMFFAFSCGSSKKVEKTATATEQYPDGMKKVEQIPLAGEKYQSNEKYFRSKMSGKSPDMATAKKIALNNAKAEIAGLIKSKVQGITDQYDKQFAVTNAIELNQKFENISRTIVSQELNDVAIIGEEVYKDKTGTIEYWIAIQVSKEAILNGIKSKVSQDQKLQIDYDKMKFEEKMNAEMDKLKTGN